MSGNKGSPGQQPPGKTGQPEDEQDQDKVVDQEVEDSFPASDPPSTTPVSGTGKVKPRDEAGNL